MIYDSLQDALAAVSAALAAGSVGRSRNGGFELAGGKATFVFKNWSTDNYVLMPAAAYNGNRFRAVNGYWPEAVTDPSPDMPVTVSNIHQLNFGPGPSRIALKGGDFSTPAVGLQFPNTKLGCWLLADQGCRVTLEEADDRRTATLTVTGSDCSWHVFDAPTIQALFDRFLDLRNERRGAARWRHEIPFSACWAIQEEKYNAQNWAETEGFFGGCFGGGVDWRPGWVGGINAVRALLAEGAELTRSRAYRTIEFLFREGLYPSGIVRPHYYRGEWSGETVLQRYNADVLFFLMKIAPVAEARRIADALCLLWERHGQFGHRVDGVTGELLWGGTCSAGIAPGGLALAAKHFNEPRYLEVARAAARKYWREFVASGVTNGGPADCLQCPDSESAFGLLDGFVTLWEVTGEAEWLQAARDVAAQCATWVVSYDFKFPPGSTFGKLDMLTTGTVFANVQNQHSAPGICSLSGDSLFKLFRATGDRRYLELIREIAHAIPQYMSRADRPICDRRPNQRLPVMPPGWINERVQMSDWEERGDPNLDIRVGEIFSGSTWAEVAMMLTWTELPGIYVQPDSGLVAVFDHVNARLDKDRLVVENPTQFPASVKLWVENQPAATRLAVPPGATVDCEVGT